MNDRQFLSALLKIRHGDAAIYDPNTKLFPDTEQPNPSHQLTVHGGKRGVYLRDVLAQQVCPMSLSGPSVMLDFIVAASGMHVVHTVETHMQAIAGASEGDWGDDDGEGTLVPTHHEEQQELKRNFLMASVLVSATFAESGLRFGMNRPAACSPFVQPCLHMQAAEATGEGQDDGIDGAVGGLLHTKPQAGGLVLTYRTIMASESWSSLRLP